MIGVVGRYIDQRAWALATDHPPPLPTGESPAPPIVYIAPFTSVRGYRLQHLIVVTEAHRMTDPSKYVDWLEGEVEPALEPHGTTAYWKDR